VWSLLGRSRRCHTLPNPALAAAALTVAISETCPPGEGVLLKIDKIFWETKLAS
jgi:hypothetical protein